jgi:hypothetical protein
LIGKWEKRFIRPPGEIQSDFGPLASIFRNHPDRFIVQIIDTETVSLFLSGVNLQSRIEITNRTITGTNAAISNSTVSLTVIASPITGNVTNGVDINSRDSV